VFISAISGLSESHSISGFEFGVTGCTWKYISYKFRFI